MVKRLAMKKADACVVRCPRCGSRVAPSRARELKQCEQGGFDMDGSPVRKRIRVYLDDVRDAPLGWHRVYWPDEAIALLDQGCVTHISLDHDLGDDSRGTGYDVIKWIEEAVVTRGFHAPHISIHSANNVARDRMQSGIESIRKACAKAGKGIYRVLRSDALTEGNGGRE